jgi:hypothetical protein
MAEALHDHSTTTNGSPQVRLVAAPESARHDDATRDDALHEDEDVPGTDKIGIALSGGGVRAALFSLGVLMYLVKSGLNQRVTTITSVSGGSITNAAIARFGDFSKMSEEEFEPVCRRLAHRLAKQGSFFLPHMGHLAKPIALCGTVLGAELVVLEWLNHKNAMAQVPGTALLLAGETVLVFLLWLALEICFRKSFQQSVYKRLVNSVMSDRKRRFGERSLPMSRIPSSDVTHILCATELLSGQPMFFSPKWVYSETFGWGRPRLTTDHAVYASAAFPGGFTPLRVKTQRLEMGGGASQQDRPPTLLLADGGVYNNLGDDWFRIVDELRDCRLRQDQRFKVPAEIGHQIIVNASSTPRVTRVSRIPLLHQCFVFARTMIVLQENTVRPRIEALNDGGRHLTLIDIAKSPVDLAQRAHDAPEAHPEEKERAAALIRTLCELKGLSGHYWDELVDDTSLLKTTLQSVGNERAARLMRHGYLSAMVALHVRFGTSGVTQVPDDRSFIELAEGVPSRIEETREGHARESQEMVTPSKMFARIGDRV